MYRTHSACLTARVQVDIITALHKFDIAAGDNANSISKKFWSLNAQECARLARDIIMGEETKLKRENPMSPAKRQFVAAAASAAGAAERKENSRSSGSDDDEEEKEEEKKPSRLTRS